MSNTFSNENQSGLTDWNIFERQTKTNILRFAKYQATVRVLNRNFEHITTIAALKICSHIDEASFCLKYRPFSLKFVEVR